MVRTGMMSRDGNHHFLSSVPSPLDTLEILCLLLFVPVISFSFFLTLLI